MRSLRDLGSVSRQFFVQKFIQGAMLSGPTSYYKELREHAGLQTGNQRLSPSCLGTSYPLWWLCGCVCVHTALFYLLWLQDHCNLRQRQSGNNMSRQQCSHCLLSARRKCRNPILSGISVCVCVFIFLAFEILYCSVHSYLGLPCT